jgi:uncharacterized membrane protein HdeD (DUF308 family)
MATVNPDFTSMQRAVWDAMAAHWRLFMVQGVVMVVLGVLAVALPIAATMVIAIFVGWLFLISGIVGLIALFSVHNTPAFLWGLLTAALSVAAGAVLVWNPVAGALSLTLVLAAFFVAEGVFQIATSFGYRHVMTASWGWLLVSGIVDLLLALVIILGWPISAAWALGLIVGINLLTSGWGLVMAAFAGRRAAAHS